MLRCDVVVIGAGPTGCYSACELARAGYDVLLLEEHEQVGEPQHCTGVIGLEAFEEFDLPRGAGLHLLPRDRGNRES